MTEELAGLAARMRACRVCEAHLPLGANPIFRLSETARLLIIGQAPGTRVHETGIPWNDRSGDRLRQWLGLDPDSFYDVSRIAILPTGLCYPGRLPRGGDCPPRPECAPLWHSAVLEHLPHLRLILLVGAFAQAHHLGSRRKATLTGTVAAWREYLPRYLVLPHPSWRTTAWEARNPWFTKELLPEAMQMVAAL